MFKSLTMKRLLQNGIARDVGIYAGIGVVAMTVKNMQKPPVYENIDSHPRLKMSPFAKILNTLHTLDAVDADSSRPESEIVNLYASGRRTP